MCIAQGHQQYRGFV
ncbi:hypothetical protein YPPY53_2913, partial [Yersinia pestis PY-53]